MKYSFKIKTLGVALMAVSILSSCTGDFDEINTDPNSLTEDQLDASMTGPAFATALYAGIHNGAGETTGYADDQGTWGIATGILSSSFIHYLSSGYGTERNDFVNEGTQILSISCDPSSSLKIFAEEQGLTTPLLSDFWPHGQVSKAYGVFLEDLGFANRGTFVIDKTGIIRWKVVTSPGEVRNTADYRLALSAL